MPSDADSAVIFAALARAVRDVPAPAELRERVFSAVEAAAASYETPAFGDCYDRLLQLAAEHAPIQAALKPALLRLALLLH